MAGLNDRKRALRVRCPECDAAPDEKCRKAHVGSSISYPMRGFHAGRRRDAGLGEAREERGHSLTAPQARMLDEIRAAGERVYNGRARKTVEALEGFGLIEYDFDLQPSIGSWTERFICRPLEAQ